MRGTELHREQQGAADRRFPEEWAPAPLPASTIRAGLPGESGQSQRPAPCRGGTVPVSTASAPAGSCCFLLFIPQHVLLPSLILGQRQSTSSCQGLLQGPTSPSDALCPQVKPGSPLQHPHSHPTENTPKPKPLCFTSSSRSGLSPGCPPGHPGTCAKAGGRGQGGKGGKDRGPRKGFQTQGHGQAVGPLLPTQHEAGVLLEGRALQTVTPRASGSAPSTLHRPPELQRKQRGARSKGGARLTCTEQQGPGDGAAQLHLSSLAPASAVSLALEAGAI